MPALPRRARRSLLTAGAALLLAPAARADEPPVDLADASPRQPTPADAASPSPYLASGGNLQVGAFRYRPWGSREPTRTGYEIGGGQAPVARFVPLAIGGTQGTRLRWFPDQGFSFSFFYDGWASVALGPVQLEGRAGITSVGVDHLLGHWSLVALSPRVAAGLAVRSGRFVAGLFAFTEVTWRWMGDDLLVRGLTLDLRAEGKREALD